jgi:hypothetical protein
VGDRWITLARSAWLLRVWIGGSVRGRRCGQRPESVGPRWHGGPTHFGWGRWRRGRGRDVAFAPSASCGRHRPSGAGTSRLRPAIRPGVGHGRRCAPRQHASRSAAGWGPTPGRLDARTPGRPDAAGVSATRNVSRSGRRYQCPASAWWPGEAAAGDPLADDSVSCAGGRPATGDAAISVVGRPLFVGSLFVGSLSVGSRRRPGTGFSPAGADGLEWLRPGRADRGLAGCGCRARRPYCQVFCLMRLVSSAIWL